MPKKKESLEEILKQDPKQILLNEGIPLEVIEKDNVEEKTLVDALKKWGRDPEISKLIKNKLLMAGIETKMMGKDVMVATIYMGSVIGIKAIMRARELEKQSILTQPLEGKA